MARLDNKVAVISGATSGIGAATAKLFADEGAQVFALGRNEEALARLETHDKDKIHGFRCDITDGAQVAAAMTAAADRYGGIDIVVANAGAFGVATAIEAYPAEVFAQVLNVNVNGVFLTIKHAVPYLKRRGGGSIIVTSSALAVKALPYMLAYQASKSALTGLVKGAAVELGPAGIRVNSVNPGLVDTPMIRLIESQMNPERPEEAKSSILEGALFKYYLEPEEVAELMVFLASDQSRSCTGSMYMMDQGVTLL
ncbi:MAG: SDR family oxidoreductase [Actinobacteria bacterium]|nr:SDR family oxidoreductase [Actinomycetota bacterium]